MAIKPKTPSSPEARKQIEKDVAAFLKSGKKIQRIPSGVSGQDGLGNRKQLVLGPAAPRRRSSRRIGLGMSGIKDYDRYDALELAQLIRSREVSAVEVLDEAIARAEAANPRLNAIVAKSLRRSARAGAQAVARYRARRRAVPDQGHHVPEGHADVRPAVGCSPTSCPTTIPNSSPATAPPGCCCSAEPARRNSG